MKTHNRFIRGCNGDLADGEYIVNEVYVWRD